MFVDLTDLIFDEMNGLSVNPSSIEIANAINGLIEKKDRLIRFQQKGYESSFRFSIENWKEKWIDVFYSENWIEENHWGKSISPLSGDRKNKKIVIITRNAYHGGVESLIKLESAMLPADVIVAGGINNPNGTCPFSYIYSNSYEELRRFLKDYDLILYHWPIDWAVRAIHDSGLPSVEFVHRIDTSDCDKSVPSRIATHSQYLIDYLKEKYNRNVDYVPNVVDLDHFYPDKSKEKKVIGSITSYYDTKGIDIVINAWASLQLKYPDYVLRFYGTGSDLGKYKQLANNLGIQVQFLDPTNNAAEALKEYRLFISGSRIEGLPITILEALAENIPVIASDIDGHRAINTMYKQSGHKDPILLFRSENSEDLARKIDVLLSKENSKIETRNVIEQLFNPYIHIERLKSIFNNLSLNAPIQETDYVKIDSSINNGVFSTGYESEGFIGDDDKNQIIRGIEATSNNNLGYRYFIPQGATDISLKIFCDSVIDTDINIQFKWLKNPNSTFRTVTIGRTIDKQTPFLYFFTNIPGNKLEVLELYFLVGDKVHLNIQSLEVTSFQVHRVNK